MSKLVVLVLPLSLFAAGACATDDSATAGTETDLPGERGPLGKADAAGTCAGEPDHCGRKSEGACWCDDLCAGYGDCCSDRASVCDAPPPPPPPDVFAAATCTGPLINTQQILGRFAPAATRAMLGSVTADARKRSCQDQTGCTAWTHAATVPLYHGNEGATWSPAKAADLAMPATGVATCTVPGPMCDFEITSMGTNVWSGMWPMTVGVNGVNTLAGWGQQRGDGPAAPHIHTTSAYVRTQVGSTKMMTLGPQWYSWNNSTITNHCLWGIERGTVRQGSSYTEYELVVYGTY